MRAAQGGQRQPVGIPRLSERPASATLGVHSTGMEPPSEMLIRAAQAGWRTSEIPTNYRQRVGESKLSTFADGSGTCT